MKARVWNYSVPVRGTEMFFVPRCVVLQSRSLDTQTMERLDLDVALKNGLYVQQGQRAIVFIKDGELCFRVEDIPPDEQKG